MRLDLKDFFKNILNLDLENDFIFLKDSNLKYIYVNKRFCKLFEIEPKDIIGKDDTVLFNDDELVDICQSSDLEALEKNYSSSSEEMFNLKFNVLKLKISIGNGKIGILGFAKLM